MTPRQCGLDSNSLISAVLQPSGATVEVLVAIRVAGGLLLFSDETFAELSTRMMRAKLDRYAEPAEHQQFLSEIAAVGRWVVIQSDRRMSRDQDDVSRIS